MISHYAVVKVAKSFADDPKMHVQLSADEKYIVRKDSGEIVDTIEGFIDFVRKDLHCDFEVIYSDALNNVHYRCRECGTVIFASDDCEDYDDNLCCPTCGGYETHFKHWTQEEIEADPKKQETLDFYQEMMTDRELAYTREKKTGLAFNELWKKNFENERFSVHIALECNNVLKEGLKGLKLHISKYERETPEDFGFHWKWTKYIPLSPYAFYIQFILPYQKKTPKELRKYLPWQKKPE